MQITGSVECESRVGVTLTLMLEVRLQELSSRLRNCENITVERAPDVLDDVDLSVARDLTIWSLDKGFAQLRYVTAALDRVLSVRLRKRPGRQDVFVRIRRTEVRPIVNRRPISDLLTPARCSFRISAV